MRSSSTRCYPPATCCGTWLRISESRSPKPNRGDLLMQLNQFLLEVYRSGSTAALLVDEAHLLSAELLEEIRLLSNIETAQHKLLQILLVGQPELDDILDSPYLRQLKQRVALRYKLEPLDESEVHGYIDRRLQLAGAPGRMMEIFPPQTLARIVLYSRGTPRLINNICDAATGELLRPAGEVRQPRDHRRSRQRSAPRLEQRARIAPGNLHTPRSAAKNGGAGGIEAGPRYGCWNGFRV